MIQRIQSLWLALAVVCIGLCFILPVAKYQYTDKPDKGQRLESQFGLVAQETPDLRNQMNTGEPVITCGPMVDKMTTWPLMTLAIVTGVIGLVCIFLFKNRRLQMRLTTLGFMSTLIYVFLLFFWAVDKYADVLSNDGMLKIFLADAKPEVTWCAGAFVPMAALVFFFLAQRAIRKDEAMVRAADRLR
jgi:cytochrome bd-type quinol oxidase subunit 2